MLIVTASAMLGPSATPDQRLWMSFTASLIAHAVALAVFAGMLMPAPVSVSLKLGDPAVMQVLLQGSQPAEAAAEATSTVDIAPPRPIIEPVRTPLAAPKVPESPPESRVPVRRIDLRAPAAHVTGAATPAESTPDAVGSDTPIPPGDVAVGAAESAEPMGHAQALRLAQRFTQDVSRSPQLRDPLVVPYPPRAARAHREARIWALLIIDANGNATEATLLPDDALFGPTVENALRSAKFKPAEADSQPVTYWLLLEFVFTMRSQSPSKEAAGR